MPGVRVLHGLGGVHDHAAHLAANLVRQAERRRFLDDLLVAALDRAFALAEVQKIAMVIAEHLELDVAGVLEILLDVDVADAERRLRLALGGAKCVRHVGRCPDDAHPAAAPAGHGLDDDRVADVSGGLERLLFVLGRTVAAGKHRHARLLHRASGPRLVAHQLDDVRVGADESNVAGLAHLGEV